MINMADNDIFDISAFSGNKTYQPLLLATEIYFTKNAFHFHSPS